jgi:hypothetical protein
MAASLFCLAVPGSLPAHAATQKTPPKVEFTVWSLTYAGTLGKKPVEAHLYRVAGKLTGDYCYQPCTPANSARLILSGELNKGHAALNEYENKPNILEQPGLTGKWKIDTLTASDLIGSWSSPDGKRTLPLKLTEQHTGQAFPFEIRLVADRLPSDQNCSGDPPHVTEIRLYRDNKLAQALSTDSQGTCDIFTPDVVDMNFDGWPDLMLAQALPAGPDIGYDSWLYAPAQGRYAVSPQSLRDVTSPTFDPERKLVWNSSRGSCCEHAIDIYRWKGNELEHIDGGESYYMPVKQDGKLRFCYVMPDYADGHVEYPGAAWDVNGRWSAPTPDADSCDLPDSILSEPGRVRVDVWREGGKGALPTLLKSEPTTTQRENIAGKPMDCPYVPVLEGGKIEHVLITNPELCVEPDPAAADKPADT